VFRGLILHTFIHTWGTKRAGTIKGVVISSLLFSSIHLLDFLSGRPLSAVLLQSLNAFLLDIVLASLVLIGKSIYPAVFFHGFLNLAGYLNLSSNATVSTASSWLLLSTLTLPIAIFGFYLLINLPNKSVQASKIYSS
jgi:membrane protease YdiL (CAAX protease family)